MTSNGFRFIGVGLYTVPEASRLSRVSTGRIRRWLRGYSFTTPSGRHLSPPVFPSALSAGDGTITVTFLDLVEIRFVDAFISAGVRWKTLRDAYARVAAALGSHPFSRGRFVTDGRAIFQEFVRERSARSDHAFADVVTGQTIFGAALTPYLATLKFDNDDLAIEWWPLGKRRRVVLNPARSFGQPIVSREGVPTATLAKAFKVEPSLAHIGRWRNAHFATLLSLRAASPPDRAVLF